jgi:cyclopropane fatty-acyl-phospholipid synthase-like methyltransferase
MACPAGRVVIHNFARRAILDALAPADRLLDVGCGGGLLLRYNSDDHRRTHRRIHDTLRRDFRLSSLADVHSAAAARTASTRSRA